MAHHFEKLLSDEIIDVNTGELKLAKCQGMLRSVAIGSCIVVACYDPIKKIGIMAHIMLPGKAAADFEIKTKYAQDAIDGVVNLLMTNGSDVKSVNVCLVGAGNVLYKDDDTICNANIESVTSTLKERGFKVYGSVLGGFERKSIRMYLDTGDVYYTMGDESERLLRESI